MKEKRCIVREVGPDKYLVAIIERSYGQLNWSVLEEFDVSADVSSIVAAHMPPAQADTPQEN